MIGGLFMLCISVIIRWCNILSQRAI